MVFGGASCLCRVSWKLFGSNNCSRCRLGKFTNLATPKKFSSCIPNVPKRCCYTYSQEHNKSVPTKTGKQTT